MDAASGAIDADGDLDIALAMEFRPNLLLVSEADRTDELYLSDGRRRFVAASERLSWNDVSNALAVTDLDGDGAPGLLTGNIGINRALNPSPADAATSGGLQRLLMRGSASGE